MADFVKNLKTSLRQMKVDRNIELPVLILSSILFSKTDVGLKRCFFFAKRHTFGSLLL